jgi:hydroxymethylpyrimidine/phosphomethylpyrimidine kinase
MPAAPQRPIVLSIAGSDPSGGAGIQADLKTFSAFGVYGMAVITALTAQSTQGVKGVLAVPPEFVALQIATLAADSRIAAVKSGMLNDAPTVRAVADAIKRHGLGPLVVDPVMVATSGDTLLEDSAVAAVRDELIPLADVITPNLPEAAKLLNELVAADEATMIEQARRLLALGCRAVVIKGGHGSGDEAIDVLVCADGTVRPYAMPRIATRNTHGTGCTFSAALAAGLGSGVGLQEAVEDAKRFVHAALEAGKNLGIGSGSGPVDHLAVVPKRP